MTESAPRRPELCVGAVIVQDGCLLLIRRGRSPGAGLWSFPGGRVEWGETMAAAVVRECLEETGLTVECGEQIGFVERPSIDHHFVIVDYWATPVDGVLRAGDDADEAAWWPAHDIRALDLVPGIAEFLDEHGVFEQITSVVATDPEG